ncbi:hypothetical protein SLEP1_g9178 [Rubroshorea leprosula]|uniref:Glycosyltransferase n=1 Tax=Rubroshorea leprosula TaxID=152421 RepID=A0AAV5IA40_9ROSI|nr:hypothetical protein SLEP1_g9178 [Rubroshorea leprosula]
MAGEIFVLPAFGQGHLFPCIELCKLIASRSYKATLVIFSTLSSSVPSSFRQHPLIEIFDIPSPSGSDPIPMHPDSKPQMLLCLENLISTRRKQPDLPRPLCAVVDLIVIMEWTADVFNKLGIPTVGFFTSGACSAAMEYATWKAQVQDIKPGEVRSLPGLPEEMAITISDLKRRSLGPPRGHGGPPAGGELGSKPRRRGPAGPGEHPSWVDETSDSIALVINTCYDLERLFIDYLARETGKPVWAVGPLLSEQYWASGGSLVRDSKIRNRQADITEEKVIEWLDSKPRGSVLYIAFGSLVDITLEEYPQLASALEESTHPFIWVIRKDAGRKGEPEGYFPHGLDQRVGERGLIIQGWAPQLLILSHKSTGGFLSHCGWNSTVEAIGRGVPFLAWPLRGDQYYDAQLVVRYLKVGYSVSEDMGGMVKKEEMVKGIEKLMGDKEMKRRAEALGAKFEHGFPDTSMAALDAFTELIEKKSAPGQ